MSFIKFTVHCEFIANINFFRRIAWKLRRKSFSYPNFIDSPSTGKYSMIFTQSNLFNKQNNMRSVFHMVILRDALEGANQYQLHSDTWGLLQVWLLFRLTFLQKYLNNRINNIDMVLLFTRLNSCFIDHWEAYQPWSNWPLDFAIFINIFGLFINDQ